MDWRMDTRGSLVWVAPFGDPRIDGYLLLPEAFRSLSRPSSALSAKASALRPFCFDIHRQILLNDRLLTSVASDAAVLFLMSSYRFVYAWN